MLTSVKCAAGLVVAAAWFASAEPTLEERLDRIVTRLEAQRKEFHVPGMSLAVVWKDQIVLARGFGERNIAEGLPATPETVYCIGSSTKAFTATMIGILQDRGVMSYDDPASKWVPEFGLQIDAADPKPEILLRDLLSHRTGFARMGMLSMGAAIPFDRTVYYMGRAEPQAKFRETFIYNNEMFLVAGHAAGAAHGTDWHTAMRSLILGPLGMTTTVTSYPEAQADERLSVGYNWNAETQTYDVLPMRDIDRCAPAGAICSNVLEMSQWVRMQLGAGEIDGSRIVSADVIAETRTPHIEIGDGASYGLGWFLHDWQGRKVVEHGGNIDGFAAEVALIPEEELGFVLLSNVTATPLQGTSQEIIWEAMLTDWAAPSDPAPADVAGRYEANFGPFKDAWFTVSVEDGKVYVDVPGQTKYELEAPNEQGRRAIKGVPGASVSFERNEESQVTQMTLHQGADIELPREGVVIDAEYTDETAKPFVGEFTCAPLGMTCKVLVQNGRLAVDVPGQMAYELRPPDAEGKRTFRITDTVKVKFAGEGPDAVPSMTMYQAGQEFVFERTGVDVVAGANQITGEKVLERLDAAGKRVAIDALGGGEMSYRITLFSQGAEGTATYTWQGNAYKLIQDFGDLGRNVTYFDGEHAWTDSPGEGLEAAVPPEIDEARLMHPFVMLGAWDGLCDSADARPAATDADRFRVELKSGPVASQRLAIDPESGDVVRMTGEITAVRGLRVPLTVDIKEHAEIGGLRVPSFIEFRNAGVGRAEMKLLDVRTGLTFDASAFRPADD